MWTHELKLKKKLKGVNDTISQEDTKIIGQEEEIDLDQELSDLKQKKTSMFHLALLRFRRNKLAIVGAVIVMSIVISAIFAPIIAPYSPLEQNVDRGLEGPSADHPLGTDKLGRDILSRLIYGARSALMVGLLVVLISGGIGIALGLLAGAFGGIVDEIVMRVVDTFLSFPVIVMAFAIAAIMGSGIMPVIIAVGIIIWTRFARVARGEILSLKNETFIESAEAIGESKFNVIVRYLFPNILPSLTIVATLQIPTALLYSASLNFLGVGIQPPTPSWGYMVATGRYYILISPWMSIFGGLAIMLTVLGFSFMGDGLRDALDPMTRGD